MTYHDHTGKPFLPEKVIELRSWADSVSHFEFSFSKLLENDDVFEVLGYQKLLSEKKDAMITYIQDLKADIKSRIVSVEQSKPLSKEKVSEFEFNSERIINEGIDEYKSIINIYNREAIYDKMKLTLRGIRDLMMKEAFVEEGIPHMNFHTIMADDIRKNSIRQFFPTSFISGATHKYLVSNEILIQALKIAKGNVVDFELIGFNIDYNFKDRILKEFPKVKFMFCSQYRLKNALFILKSEDLPVIVKREPHIDIIKKFKLKQTSNNSTIFASVLDLGLEDNSEIKKEWLESKTEETLHNKVQVMVWMLWLILWKKDRQIIQFGIDTRDEERGIRNSLNDIIPLNS